MFLVVIIMLYRTILISAASPGTYDVSWRVVYTDSTYAMTIAEMEEGTCLNGTEIYVGTVSETSLPEIRSPRQEWPR